MSQRKFKAQASSSRATTGVGFGGFGAAESHSVLSYLKELPDLDSKDFGNPNINVHFKNISKKDATTKTKALENLRECVEAFSTNKQDAKALLTMFETWADFYPRLSIDNDRRVRELAHHLQGDLQGSLDLKVVSGKFWAKIVPPWFAGTFDKDRGVARIATEGTRRNPKFTTLLQMVSPEILDYAIQAIQETPESLSDDRITTPEDMQAKYFRVLGSGISMIRYLISDTDIVANNKIHKQLDAYEQFQELWSLVSSEDSSVRKSVCQLLEISLKIDQSLSFSPANQLKAISNAFVVKGLVTDQSNSNGAFIHTLIRLTSTYPQVWTIFEKEKGSSRKSKTKARNLIQKYVEKGSQGHDDFWNDFEKLFPTIPPDVFGTSIDSSLPFLKSMRQGMATRGQQHLSTSAWHAYVSVITILLSRREGFEANKTKEDSMLDEEGELLSQTLFPLFTQYLLPSAERIEWSIKLDSKTTTLLADTFIFCASLERATSSHETFRTMWEAAGSDIDRKIWELRKGPKEGQSAQEFYAAQEEIMSISKRWFSLLKEVLPRDKGNKAQNLLVIESVKIVKTAVRTLLSSGDVYCAGRILEDAMRFAPTAVFNYDAGTTSFFTEFFEYHIPSLIFTESATYLVAIVHLLKDLPKQEGQNSVFEKAWVSAIDEVVKDDVPAQAGTGPRKIGRTALLRSFMVDGSLNGPEMGKFISHLSLSNTKLQKSIYQQISKAMVEGSDEGALGLLEAVAACNSLTQDTTLKIQNDALLNLTPDAAGSTIILRVLYILSLFTPRDLWVDCAVDLMSKLFILATDADTPILKQLRLLQEFLDSEDPQQPGKVSLRVIHSNLESANEDSLPIQVLVDQALAMVANSNLSINCRTVFPNDRIWKEAIEIEEDQNLDPALGAILPFAGAVYVANHYVESEKQERNYNLPRDRQRFSIADRMAIFTSQLMIPFWFKESTTEPNYTILSNLLLTYVRIMARVETGCSLHQSKKQGDISGLIIKQQLEQQYLERCDEIFSKISKEAEGWWREQTKSSGAANGRFCQMVDATVRHLLDTANATTARAYHAMRALAHLLQCLDVNQEWRAADSDAWVARLDIINVQQYSNFRAAAVMFGLEDKLRGSISMKRTCEALINRVAAARPEDRKTTLELLFYTNASMSVFEGDLPFKENQQQRRLTFAARSVINWTSALQDENPDIELGFASVVCHFLILLLPNIGNERGTFWETALNFCANIWNSPRFRTIFYDSVAAVGMSLKLFSTLRGMRANNNKTLNEALDEFEAKQMWPSLLELLKLDRPEDNQPLQDVDERLSRLIRQLSPNPTLELTDFYPLLASEFKSVQTAAYSVLVKNLSKQQEEYSIQNALNDSNGQLPLELMSLLINAPDMDSFAESDEDDFIPGARSYLYSWLLVFEAFAASSIRVRGDYSTHLKTENCITPLLDLVFLFLGHTEGKPLDLNKEHIEPVSIRKYDLQEDVDSMKDLQLMMINIYYSALKYIPNLVNNWRLQCTSRQTILHVEQWTEKYFSPIIVHDTLQDVNDWSRNQEAVGDEKDLEIKTSSKTGEVYAGYEVDDMEAKIKIEIPMKYPFENVKVIGVNRVAAKSEQTWNAWLMTIQGVIQFSNGSIIDGLIVFRKNIVNALKGQTECAICYSIISSAKKLPDKRCGTCKNLFHGDCLFKWFATGNQNTCPLCRTRFSFAPVKRGARGADAN